MVPFLHIPNNKETIETPEQTKEMPLPTPISEGYIIEKKEKRNSETIIKNHSNRMRKLAGLN